LFEGLLFADKRTLILYTAYIKYIPA